MLTGVSNVMKAHSAESDSTNPTRDIRRFISSESDLSNQSTNSEEQLPTKTTAIQQPIIKFKDAIIISKGEFEPEKHFYPRVLNAQLHPLVSSFFTLGNERIVARYVHLNPQINEDVLKSILNYKPKYFQWAVGDEHGVGGYGIVIENTFKDMIKKCDPSVGGLAVIYDKNYMEATGYAAVMAEWSKENVWLAEFYIKDPDPPVKWKDGVLFVRDEKKEWHPIRACFRYVTQKPWNRFPVNSKTLVLNNILSCLAGGRNKMMAAKAYDSLNEELVDTGLRVRVPEVPYSNAGQGVYTITNQNELMDFMQKNHQYGKFIVQSLVGNASWSSSTREGKFYHVGTIPNKKMNTFATDLRMMVTANDEGFRPIATYARKARKPLIKHLEDNPSITSWEMLGTNLSVNEGDVWSTETQRLLLMDRKDFNQLGIGIDDLIDAYIQTVLSVIAIDKMCIRLVKDNPCPETVSKQFPWFNEKLFDFDLFSTLNPDKALLNEIMKYYN